MKKVTAWILVVVLGLMLVGCGADEKKLSNGVTYDTYGLLSENQAKNPNVEYQASGWSIFWGIIFIETIAAPIYFFGYDLFEPVGLKVEGGLGDNNSKGVLR